MSAEATLRQYVRMLVEAAMTVSQAESNELALLVYKGHSDVDLVLYSPSAMKTYIVSDEIRKRDDVAKEAVYGFISYARPHTPGKAWYSKVVGGSAARKGYGPLMYDIAMSDARTLTSDRNSVSDSAERVWDKYQERDDVEKLKFDDVFDPKTPPPEDDAKLHPEDRPSLNYAYRLKDGGPDIDKLIQNHLKMVEEVAAEVPDYTKADINAEIRGLGCDFFGAKYDELYEPVKK